MFAMHPAQSQTSKFDPTCSDDLSRDLNRMKLIELQYNYAEIMGRMWQGMGELWQDVTSCK